MTGKKVFIDLLNLATPQIAGVGVFTRNLLSQWFIQNEFPHLVVCYSSHVINAEEVFGFKTTFNIQVKIIRVKHVLARLIYQQLVLPFILKKYDVYYNPAVGIPFLAKIFSPKTKLIVTIHDMAPFFYAKKYGNIRSLLVKILSKYAARVAHTIVTVSKNSKDDLVKIGKISHRKVFIVYNFITHEPELKNHIDEKYFLCISTIEPGKNIENTIKGFAKFKTENSYDQYKFYWIGRIGWVYTEAHIKSLIKECQIEDSFVLLGYLMEEEKVNWIRNCTAIVYLSHYEGFGLPVLEGLSFNKPAVVSNTSSLPEVIGKAGSKCDPNDTTSIAQALKMMISLRENYILEIPTQLQKFDSKTQIKTFDQLIANNT